MRTQLGWAPHNLIGHPVSELCWWAGHLFKPARRLGDWIHDVTLPKHISGNGRG